MYIYHKRQYHLLHPRRLGRRVGDAVLLGDCWSVCIYCLFVYQDISSMAHVSQSEPMYPLAQVITCFTSITQHAGITRRTFEFNALALVVAADIAIDLVVAAEFVAVVVEPSQFDAEKNHQLFSLLHVLQVHHTRLCKMH